MISVDAHSPVWPKIEYGLFVLGEVLAFPCYLFVMYHLLATKASRKLLYNHPVVIMLIYNWLHLGIDLSMTLNYIRLGFVSPFAPALCLIQQFVDTGLWYGAIFLMLWISIERHILIFHANVVASLRRRVLFHYIPLAVFVLYAPVFYFYLVFLFPCEHIFYIDYNLCGGSCYYEYSPPWLNWYESTVNYVIPILLIVVFNVGLFTRILLQKRRVQQSPNWRQNQKMIMQLLAVSSVYLLFDLPYIIIMIVQWAGIPEFGYDILSPYITHLTYVPAIILPFSALATLPQVKNKLLSLLLRTNNRRRVLFPTIQVT